ncbi:MAG: hypothetical protein J6S80_04200 [Alphaproteobacteria bacterium]|nr:hypothetical protein [Alphaproteobacteria bacterium]
MSDIKDQIFQELTKLDESAAHLRATAINAGKQTDLEVAILTEQVRNLRARNAHAVELIDQSVELLKKLQ